MTSAWFEPANSGTRGQDANHYNTEAVYLYQLIKLCLPEFAQEILPIFIPNFLSYFDRGGKNAMAVLMTLI